ncbi:hypothetical protein Q9S36_06625 [Microbacterium sp. ARD31]|uniref:hypothetical protein n=1 Tax=Microbacterium sp. ARD31 TaxID=2962576 RepID=UPI0028829698|nr:hypothetical protein [Microbacterium sp. ARD31]MDT0179885.1 hypothetical protein [Microbacterium sp. ARD31]
MSASRGRTYLIQIDVISQEFVTILDDGSLVLEDAVTGDYVTLEVKDLDKFAASNPPYTAHVADCIRRDLLDDTHDLCGWEWTEQPQGHWWYRVGKCPKCHPRISDRAPLSLLNDGMPAGELDESDGRRLSWICGAHHVRARPWLTMSWVAHPDQTPHLAVHDGPIGPALHFDSVTGPTFAAPEGIIRLTWTETLADHNAWSTTWGPADDNESFTPKCAAYHALATLICLDDSWRVMPARFIGNDDDPLSVTSIETRFITAQPSMMEYLGLLETQYAEGVATHRPEYWHEPMWVGLKDGQPLVLVDEAGAIHTGGMESQLPKTPEEVEQLVRKLVEPHRCGQRTPTTPRPALTRTSDRSLARGSSVGDERISVATWTSRVRGLMLGIALGDSVGSIGSTGTSGTRLKAGAATELAGWTVEGLLRTFTSYDWAIQSPNEVMHAYQRWALLRGASSLDPGWDPLPIVDGRVARGWLIDTPEMTIPHGSSPTMMKVALTGNPTREPSSRGVIKGLPYGALAGAGEFSHSGADKVASYGGMLATETHTHPHVTGGAVVSTFLVVEVLRSTASLSETLGVAANSVLSLPGFTSMSGFPRASITSAIDRGLTAPRSRDDLSRLVAEGNALGALLGGLYVAASFADHDGAEGALDFCSRAARGRDIAPVAFALLGAAHGFESLPHAIVTRLELGWIMDRLAIDLAMRVSAPSWQPADARAWRAKYPASPVNEGE